MSKVGNDPLCRSACRGWRKEPRNLQIRLFASSADNNKSGHPSRGSTPLWILACLPACLHALYIYIYTCLLFFSFFFFITVRPTLSTRAHHTDARRCPLQTSFYDSSFFSFFHFHTFRVLSTQQIARDVIHE